VSEDYVSYRMDVINSLKGKLEQAEKRIKYLKENIDKNGISANFSVNEDLLEISKLIWKYCYMLKMQKDLHKKMNIK